MTLATNITLTAMFGALGIWMLMNLLRTRNKVKYKDRMWTGTRILFLICGILILTTIFAYSTWLDYLRLAFMLLSIFFYLFLRDGVGEEGVCSTGRLVPWDQVRSYDYEEGRKDFKAWFTVRDTDRKGRASDFNMSVSFDKKDEEEVRKYLNEKIGRKYTRRRKY